MPIRLLTWLLPPSALYCTISIMPIFLHFFIASIHSIWCSIYMFMLMIQSAWSDCLSFYINAVSFILILLLFSLIAYSVFLFRLPCCITSLKAWYFIPLHNLIQFDFIYMVLLTIDVPESRTPKIFLKTWEKTIFLKWHTATITHRKLAISCCFFFLLVLATEFWIVIGQKVSINLL